MDELDQFKKKLDELEDAIARLSFVLKEVKSLFPASVQPHERTVKCPQVIPLR